MNSRTENTKFFYIRTFGCKVNQYESQTMREVLVGSGFRESPSCESADFCIVNTCTVTEGSDKDSRHAIGALHRANPDAKIVVTGCYAEMDSDEISSIPGVSRIVKNIDKYRIDHILSDSIPDKGGKQNIRYKDPVVTGFKDHTKAFIKIQDGCDNGCAYCKVPLVRDILRSKPMDLIVKEASVLADNGFKEIVLTGICMGLWGKDAFEGLPVYSGMSRPGLADVLKALDGVKSDFRIRLSSIEPLHVTDELIEFISGNKRICPHLHIPLQSGDDRTLSRMKRPYSSGYYKKLVQKLRSEIKDIAITTDIIVGFPGETGEDFNKTLEFLKEVRPSRTHIFTFSRRRGTAAFDMPTDIDQATVENRYHRLNVAAIGSSYLYRSKYIGRDLDILVESRRARHSGLLTGYSGNYIRVVFEGPDSLMGRIVPVTVTDVNLAGTFGIYRAV